jgi:ABC-2 type transport system ATP-binding protein
MNLFQQKINEVVTHIANGDDDLGYRRLIDCALDTNDTATYKACIQFHEWREQHELDKPLVREKSIAFLQDLANKNIPDQQPADMLLNAKALKKNYSRGNFTLGAITLQINSGNIIGLVGENGNGKTTLLRILANELSLDSGTIFYKFALNKQDNYDLRSQLIYIPQRTPTWYGLVKDNLKLTATHYGLKGEANEAIVMMYIIRFGLWKYRDMKWSELSSGYKMRFELARTFLRQPKIMFLDEPLANLDILAQQLILEDLKYMAKSLSHPVGIILSSQVLYEVEKVSDEVVFLKNGQQDSFNRLKTANNENSNTYIELETDSNKEMITAALQQFDIVQLTLNGGAYNIEVKNSTANALLKALIEKGVVIKYYRDITFSTRRLFN